MSNKPSNTVTLVEQIRQSVLRIDREPGRSLADLPGSAGPKP